MHYDSSPFYLRFITLQFYKHYKTPCTASKCIEAFLEAFLELKIPR